MRYFTIRKAETKAGLGTAKEHIPLRAAIITTTGPTIPASTAAEPITIPPTMPKAELTGEGSLTPASLQSSKAVSIISTSAIAGKGT